MGSPIGGLPGPPFLVDGKIAGPWKAWLSTANQVLQDISNSGTTAQRPTNFLYIGKPYFDTTLGVPIAVKSLSPTVWVNGVGTPV